MLGQLIQVIQVPLLTSDVIFVASQSLADDFAAAGVAPCGNLGIHELLVTVGQAISCSVGWPLTIRPGPGARKGNANNSLRRDNRTYRVSEIVRWQYWARITELSSMARVPMRALLHADFAALLECAQMTLIRQHIGRYCDPYARQTALVAHQQLGHLG